MTQFGFLAKLDFLQTWVSLGASRVNPAVTHNLGKYLALHKAFYLSAIDEKAGDYLEFGVFRGSSFAHALRCANRMVRYSKTMENTRFFGFDSFQGFGELKAEDRHAFYQDENFKTEIAFVDRRSKAAAKKLAYKLIPGFFDQSLAGGPAALGIDEARIIFIDSDTYESADQALRFCDTITAEGTIIILDDFFSYRGREDRGVARAFGEFQERISCGVRRILDYGMGGAVYIVSSMKS